MARSEKPKSDHTTARTNKGSVVSAATLVLGPRGAWWCPAGHGSASSATSSSIAWNWQDDAATLGKHLEAMLASAASPSSSNLSRNPPRVALDSSWVLVQSLTVPSADPHVIAGAVRMRVARDYATAADGLAVDFVVRDHSQGAHVLLAAVRRDRLVKINEVLQHAKLLTTSRSRSGLAIHLAAEMFPPARTQGGAGNEASAELVITPVGSAIIGRSSLNAGRLDYLSDLSGDSADMMVEQLRLALMSQSEVGDVQQVRYADPSSRTLAEGCASVLGVRASAVDGAMGFADDVEAINFTRARLDQPLKQSIPAWKRWSAMAAILALVVLLGFGWTWWSRAKDVNRLEERLAELTPKVEAVQATASTLRSAEPWFRHRAPVLNCLYELTIHQPENGELRVTGFTFTDGQDGTLACRADRESTMHAYVTGLGASEALSEVRLRDWSEYTGDQRGVQFEISFQFERSAFEFESAEPDSEPVSATASSQSTMSATISATEAS